jgi:hypothetical protein
MPLIIGASPRSALILIRHSHVLELRQPNVPPHFWLNAHESCSIFIAQLWHLGCRRSSGRIDVVPPERTAYEVEYRGVGCNGGPRALRLPIAGLGLCVGALPRHYGF